MKQIVNKNPYMALFRRGNTMGRNGMDSQSLGQTTSGGEYMEPQEITLGQVTYQVSRVYAGDRPASELVADRLVKRLSENPPFDEGHIKVV